jgi:hypothetical protein
MVSNRFNSAVITSFVLAISACTNTVPNNFQNPDKDYAFNTKELSDSYIIRKFQTWLNATPVNGAAIVKEIAYARTKYPAQFIRIMTANTELLGNINDVQAVKDRIAIDYQFKVFLESCEPFTPPAFVGEFQVNIFTAGRQYYPSVAIDNAGNYVVTWMSEGQDGDSYGIYARRHNSSGVPQGSEFQANTSTTGLQANPSVAMDNSGDFVIVWRSDQGFDSEIFAQKYNSRGIAAGSEFRVNAFTINPQNYPSVAMDSIGDLTITWIGYGNQDGDGSGIFARRYNSAGIAQVPANCGDLVLNPNCSPVTGQFQVNTGTTSSQLQPAIAMNGAGRSVISWVSYGQDGNGFGIYAQMYNSSGDHLIPSACASPLCDSATGELRVNTYINGDQFSPSVAINGTGGFVVSWKSPQDGDQNGIYAQRYYSSGVAQGSEFRVNTYTTGNQTEPSVAMDNSGDFVISWFSPQDEDNGYGIYAQRYNANGETQIPENCGDPVLFPHCNPATGEFRVNSYTTGTQAGVKTAMNSTGNFVFAWQSSGEDGSGYGIYGQRYNASGVAQ